MAPLTAELMSSMDEGAKREYAKSFNTKQEILNRQLLPEPLGAAPIIVVMVHNRPLYFAAVLRSLSQARGIEKALLVVSLDYLSPEMDALVRGITFCAVVQIFCPASVRTDPPTTALSTAADPRFLCAGAAVPGDVPRHGPSGLRRGLGLADAGQGQGERLPQLGHARQVRPLQRGEVRGCQAPLVVVRALRDPHSF